MPSKSESGGIFVFSSFYAESVYSEMSFIIIPLKLLPPTPLDGVSRIPPEDSLVISLTYYVSFGSDALRLATATSPPSTVVSSTRFFTTSSFGSDATALRPYFTEILTGRPREAPPPPMAATVLPFGFS